MPDPILKSELPAGFTFSQSSLQDFTDCPRRFQLRYIERLVWPAIEMEPVLENERRQQAGLAFHRMVQQHLIGLPVEKLAPPPGSAELARWWQNYLNATLLPQDPSAVLHVEQVLTAPVGGYHLLAKYDLIVFSSDGKARIFDWKTTRKRPRDEWMAARLQTRVYRALLVQAGACLHNGTPLQPEQVEMIYWYAEYPTQPALFPYTAAQYQREWDGLCVLIQEIAHHRYFPPAEVDQKCACCTYRSYCNRGEKAGSVDEAEAEMDPPAPEFDLEQIAEIEL